MPSHGVSLKHATLHDEIAAKYSSDDRYGFSQSATSSQDGDTETETEISASLRVGLVVQRSTEGYTARANSLQSYLEMNRHVRITVHVATRVSRTHEHAIVFVTIIVFTSYGSRKSLSDRR